MQLSAHDFLMKSVCVNHVVLWSECYTGTGVARQTTIYLEIMIMPREGPSFDHAESYGPDLLLQIEFYILQFQLKF